MKPKVLIACPVSQKKEYCAFDWVKHIRQLTYLNAEILMVDNSENPTWHYKLLDMGVNCLHIYPEGPATQYITRSVNIIRMYALQQNFDYFMSIEVDNFPPLQVIELLMAYDKDNISLPYFLWHPSKKAARLGVQEIATTSAVYKVAKVLPPFYDNYSFDGQLKPYYAPSLGCTLISRKLLQRVKFTFDPQAPNKFHDSFFHMNSNIQGFQPWVLMSYICEHRRGTWKYILQKDMV